MKKIMFLFWVAYTLPFFGQKHQVPSLEDNIKIVNWIHGVGNPDFWLGGENYPTILSSNPNYLIHTNVIKVPNTNSIGIAKFAQAIEPQAEYLWDRSFAIAHSMGGMAARRIDVDRTINGSPSRKFGGIVTVGTPLLGAAGARSLVDGKLDNFIYNFTFKITDPFASPLVATLGGSLVNAIIPWLPAGTITSAILISGAGTTIVYEVVKDQAKGVFSRQFNGQTRIDLIPGNDKYQTGQTCQTTYKWIPNPNGYFFPYSIVQATQCDPAYANYAEYATPTPKVHFVGQEDQPIFMKILESTREGRRYAQELTNIRDVAYGLRWAGFVDPIFAIKCGALGDYLGDGVNVDYAGMIDAVHTERRHRLEEIPTRLWNCFYQRQRTWSRHCGWFSWFCGWIEDFINVWACAFRTIFVEIWVGYDVPVIDPSDGVVSAVSQRGDGSKWKSNLEAVKLKGVNHNEMNGHKEMTEALKNLFEGTDPKVAPVFKVTK